MNVRSLVFNQVKSVAEKFGVFLSRDPSNRDGHLREFLKWAKINCVLDVGGFVGKYALVIAAGPRTYKI
jgi:hypothetical protein